MNLVNSARPSARAARIASPIGAVLVATALAMVASSAQAAIGTPVPLGAASTFAVLAGAGVTNTGATTLRGDIGSFPTTSLTGMDTVTLVGGVNHDGDAVTQQAKTNLVTAYDAASAQSPDQLGGVELAGLTLEPGVYDTGGVIELNGNLTLDANGDPNAVFVFQSLSTLLAGAASSITFIDGATACNLYWRVPSSATIGAGSRFAGTILAQETITFGAGATLQGRALARTGAVTLINNTITVPACSSVSPTTTPTTTPPATSTPTTTPTTGLPATTPATPPATPPTTPSGTGTTTSPAAALPATPPTTPSGTGTTTSPGSAAAGSPTGAPAGPQVPVVPRGGVQAGDGSSIEHASGVGPTFVALALTVLGIVGWVTVRSRRSGSGE